MKKFIPLLLTLPLLAACGNNVKVVKPTFAEKGTEKTYAEVLEAVSDANDKAAINKEEFGWEGVEELADKILDYLS